MYERGNRERAHTDNIFILYIFGSRKYCIAKRAYELTDTNCNHRRRHVPKTSGKVTVLFKQVGTNNRVEKTHINKQVIYLNNIFFIS